MNTITYFDSQVFLIQFYQITSEGVIKTILISFQYYLDYRSKNDDYQEQMIRFICVYVVLYVCVLVSLKYSHNDGHKRRWLLLLYINLCSISKIYIFEFLFRSDQRHLGRFLYTQKTFVKLQDQNLCPVQNKQNLIKSQ